MPLYRELQIWKYREGIQTRTQDRITSEEPLAIRIEYGSNHAREIFTLAVTMRSPGNDEQLAAGFLYTEGIIDSANQISGIHAHIGSGEHEVLVSLHPDFMFDPTKWQRNFYTSSSCGVCGKGAIEQVHTTVPFLLKKWSPTINPGILQKVKEGIRNHQAAFHKTGGIHAAALYREDGECITVKEDVGRHNAMDKLLGHAMKELSFPLLDYCVLVSGRASFELVQKALMAGIPILIAFGAPSSLAIDLGHAHQMTIIGFLKDDSFNVYCGEERLQWAV